MTKNSGHLSFLLFAAAALCLCVAPDNNVIPTPTVTDIDGNIYQTVKIGTQVWMAENLRTITYRDGSPIQLITNEYQWSHLTTPGVCWYNFDSITYAHTYGAFYNWYAVNTGKLAPTGWHVPTDSEWSMLTTYCNGESMAGGKLKETGTMYWSSPNTGATNVTGFSALPGGCHAPGDGGPMFLSIENNGYWWSSTMNDTTHAWCRVMSFNNTNVDRIGFDYKYGFSVRCIKDP
jgi:uncharacterized protein (TIGR02145 family)